MLAATKQTPACVRLFTNPQFRDLISNLGVTMQTLIVDDERTRNVLVRAGNPHLPLLLIDTGDNIMQVRGVSFIIKFLTDLNRTSAFAPPSSPLPLANKHQSTSQQYPESPVVYTSPSDDIIFPTTVSTTIPSSSSSSPRETTISKIYESTEGGVSIYHVDCSGYTPHLNTHYSSVILNDTCKMVSAEGINVITVTATIASLTRIVPLFGRPGDILVVSKSKKLSQLVTALYMFYIEKRSLEEIQQLTNLQIKKPMSDLFVLDNNSDDEIIY